MALSNAERQKRYRSRIRRGELEKIHVVLPGEVGAKLSYVMAATGEGKTELLSRLILEEWNRQGQPVGRPRRRRLK